MILVRVCWEVSCTSMLLSENLESILVKLLFEIYFLIAIAGAARNSYGALEGGGGHGQEEVQGPFLLQPGP